MIAQALQSRVGARRRRSELRSELCSLVLGDHRRRLRLAPRRSGGRAVRFEARFAACRGCRAVPWLSSPALASPRAEPLWTVAVAAASGDP
jgi:hypothetical protein